LKLTLKSMPINEKGEFIREPSHNKSELEIQPEAQLASMKEGLLVQSTHPDFSQKPPDVLFWQGARLEHNKELNQKMRQYAEQYNITEFTDPYTNEHMVLSDFFDKIERSIVYSSEMGPRIEEHNKQTKDADEEEKAKLRRMLFDKLSKNE